jgi:hypothetical protein
LTCKNAGDAKIKHITKPAKFYKLNLPEILLKEVEPISRAYQTNHEQSRSHETKPIKTYADQNRKLKTLMSRQGFDKLNHQLDNRASFSDSTKPTRNFADKRNAVEQKAKLTNRKLK